MIPSEELTQVTLRVLNALLSADHETYASLISQQEGVLMIGSAPEEWIEGYPAIVETLKLITEGLKGAQAVEVASSAYQEGNVGWSATRFTLRLPNGAEVPFRLTAILVREDRQWKVVQWHDSIGLPDEMTMGAGDAEE